MPVAFGLGFQNNFHLLSVNWWQPWELGVKASIYQPSLVQGILECSFQIPGSALWIEDGSCVPGDSCSLRKGSEILE